ncbi:hypothetical protein Taro_016469 [Colocasia esculenta]|uniref:Uncharacterized protein n=1 Tax=Colocasia esculenta TaxID=4460 RepID=A0A843UNW5_COLES|nr:hypothetical protein [Colocasia esculenta]
MLLAKAKSRVGLEMKQDLLLFSWSWRPGVAVDWLASMLVDVDCLNLAAVDVDTKGGGSEEWLDDRRTRGVAELREETSRRGAIPGGARGGLGVNREILEWLENPQSQIRVSVGALVVGGTDTSRRTAPQLVLCQCLTLASPGQGLLRCQAWACDRVSADEISEMADRRDWGGGGDDSEESTQRMIERIWESLTDIRARMDQQAPVPLVAVPPGDGEPVPVAPVPPRVEVPFAAPVPPPPPVLIAEEPVMQVEKFLRLQPPTYSGGPNPDTAEHWVHEIERVFATMRCPAADRVVRARRTFLVRRPVQGRAVAVQGQYLQRSSSSCVVLQQCSFVAAYFL